MILKGYLEDIQAQHKKATAWYFMALEKCSTSQRAGVLMDIGTSLSKQGEYDRAWLFMKRARRTTETLLTDPSVSGLENIRQNRIHVDVLSRTGALYEGIGDYDKAMECHNEAIQKAMQNSFADLVYKTYSRKMKLMLFLARYDEAEKCLLAAQEYLQKCRAEEPRFALFIDHDWARFYRATKDYNKAMAKYKEILYGVHQGLPCDRNKIDYVIEDQADLFGEVAAGIVDCLYSIGRTRLSEALDDARSRYREYIKRFGIYEELDKRHETLIVRNRTMVLLDRVFELEPIAIEYKDIEITYDPERHTKAVLSRGGAEFHLPPRSYYVIKCLMQNIGECVSQKQIEEFLKDHGENIGGGSSIDSGIRNYISRLRKVYGFDRFIVNCPRGSGWKLKM